MATIESAGTIAGVGSGILDREHTIAKAGFNRWLVPPAALCIHLCIGMAYGFSVFWLPLSRAIGLTAPKACPDMSLVQELFTTTCDWKVASLGWMFTLFFVLLGVSAAIWGGWLERRPVDRRIRRLRPSALDHVARRRRHRRRWSRPRLHLAGLDPDQMVPRSPRHGHRFCHRRLRRRRHDRRTAGEYSGQLLQNSHLGRRLGDVCRHGRDLFRLHDH